MFQSEMRTKKYNESLDIINKEPIDVLIKYIDLSDPNLKREGIKQIKNVEKDVHVRNFLVIILVIVDCLTINIILQLKQEKKE